MVNKDTRHPNYEDSYDAAEWGESLFYYNCLTTVI